MITVRQSARAQVTQLDNAGFINQLSGAAKSLLGRPNGVADFQEARLFFECGLARYAARYASPKEIGRLGAALAQNEKAIGNPALFATTDLAFHDILAEIPQNPIFVALNPVHLRRVVSSSSARWACEAPSPAGTAAAYEGHAAIYEAIAAHDIEAADKAMMAHLELVSSYYWKSLAEAGD